MFEDRINSVPPALVVPEPVRPAPRVCLYPIEWMHLSWEERQILVKQFNIPRSGSTIVTDNIVETDGYTVNDLKTFTVARMQEFTGSTETDLHMLVQLSIAKLMSPATPEKAIIEEPSHAEEKEPVTIESEETNKKQTATRGRSKKVAGGEAVQG